MHFFDEFWYFSWEYFTSIISQPFIVVLIFILDNVFFGHGHGQPNPLLLLGAAIYSQFL